MQKETTILGFLILLSPALCFAKAHQSVPFLSETNMQFIENKGQVTDQYKKPRKDVQFVLASNGVSMFIGNGQIHYQFTQSDSRSPNTCDATVSGYRTDVTLVGANAHARVITEEQQAYVERYNTTGMNGAVAHSYRKITYQNIYPHIDWVLYVKNDQLEYDFVVKPGGKASDIKLKYDGATGLKINNNGALVLSTPMGNIKEHAPVSYVQATGKKVKSSFILKGNTLGFCTKQCKGTMIIDPTLTWGTYYGGQQGNYGGGQASQGMVSIDSFGNVYLLSTASGISGLATTGAYQTTYIGNDDIVLAKFNGAGQRLWATYYGGNHDDVGVGITCDVQGDVYITGYTASTSGIATTNAFQTTYNGTTTQNLWGDAFLVKFDSSGNLKWGTYYGGSGSDVGNSVSCDAQGNVYLAGATNSTGNIATTGSFQDTVAAAAVSINNGGTGGFLAKFDSTGSRIWATYYGGYNGNGAIINSVVSDTQGHVFITGYTNDTIGIATPGTYLVTYPAADQSNASSAFVAEFDSAGNRIWGTYYGTDEWGDTYANAIATDGAGNTYIGGLTQSQNGLASANAYHPISGGSNDGFLAKFNNVGQLSWSTYYGGTLDESVRSIACDLAGFVYITGVTNSPDNISTPGALDSAEPGNNFFSNAFIAEFNGAGSMQWGTYYGGAGGDAGQSIVADRLGNLYLGGATGSESGIATPDGFMTSISPFGDVNQLAFLAKFNNCTPPPATITATGPTAFCQGDSVLLVADTGSTLSYKWQNNGAIIAGATGYIYVASTAGIYSLVQTNIFTCADTSATDTVVVYPLPMPVITMQGNTLSTGSYNSYQWLAGNDTITGATGQTYTASMNDTFYVVVTDGNGCSKESAPFIVNNLSVSQISAAGNSIHVYPNPASSIVYIDAAINVNVSVRSVDGRILLQQNNVKSVNISNLATGIYMLQVTDSEGTLLKVDEIIKTAQ